MSHGDLLSYQLHARSISDRRASDQDDDDLTGFGNVEKGPWVSRGPMSRGEAPSDDVQWRVQVFESFPFSSPLLFFSDLDVVSFVLSFSTKRLQLPI